MRASGSCAGACECCMRASGIRLGAKRIIKIKKYRKKNSPPIFFFTFLENENGFFFSFFSILYLFLYPVLYPFLWVQNGVHLPRSLRYRRDLGKCTYFCTHFCTLFCTQIFRQFFSHLFSNFCRKFLSSPHVLFSNFFRETLQFFASWSTGVAHFLRRLRKGIN